MSKAVLHIENLTVGYTKHSTILKGVNVAANSGEVILVIGENGSGKSTLLKTISGLLKFRSGSIAVLSRSLSDWNKSDLSKKVSYVASRENMNLNLTVTDFVAFGRYPYSNWLSQQSEIDKALIAESIKACGIEYLADKKVSEISDGEKQKVSLARAIAQETEILILDEPTTHLDIKSTNSILKLIKQQKGKEKCIVFSSHQVEKAIKVADKVWVVSCGKVIEASVESFLQNKELKELVFGVESF